MLINTIHTWKAISNLPPRWRHTVHIVTNCLSSMRTPSPGVRRHVGGNFLITTPLLWYSNMAPSVITSMFARYRMADFSWLWTFHGYSDTNQTVHMSGQAQTTANISSKDHDASAVKKCIRLEVDNMFEKMELLKKSGDRSAHSVRTRTRSRPIFRRTNSQTLVVVLRES